MWPAPYYLHCFRHSQLKYSSHQTCYHRFRHLFCLWSLYVEWPCPSSPPETLASLDSFKSSRKWWLCQSKLCHLLSFLLPATFRFNHWNDQTVQAGITSAKTKYKVTLNIKLLVTKTQWQTGRASHRYSICLCPTSKMHTFTGLLNQAQMATVVLHVILSFHTSKQN